MPDYPSTLSGVVSWIDGRAQAFSDAGGAVPANPFAGRVRRINQSSPASGIVQSASDAVRPFRETGALNFQVGGGHYLAAPISAACAQDDLTFACNFTMRDNFPGGPQWLVYNNATFQVLTFSNNVINVKYNGGTNWFVAPAGAPTSYALAPIGSRVTMTVRSSPSGLAASVIVDGVRTDYTLAVSIANTSLAGANWLVGWDGVTPGGELHGSISQQIIVSRRIADGENDALIAWLQTVLPERAPADVPMVVITGDSIARGYLLESDRSAIWSFIAQQNLNAAQPVNVVNAAISGSGIANQAAAYPATMAPFYSPSRSRNVFVGAIGTNDMATLSHDGPTTIADYYAFLDARLAEGWRPVACTVLPRSGTGHDASFDAARAYFNTRVRAEWAARGYSALADVAAISGMGADDDDANATYYLDAIHPTFAGNALLEPVYRTAIQDALTPDPPSLVTTKYQMQGVAISDQSLVPWLADAPDWTGAFAQVPVTDVTLYARSRR